MGGFTNDYKYQLEDILQAYREFFKDPKGYPPKSDVDHAI